MNLKVGDTLVIHCYKHNGTIHKSWNVAYVLDIKRDYIVLGNENVLVTKQDGRTWRTKEPAIMFFTIIGGLILLHNLNQMEFFIIAI